MWYLPTIFFSPKYHKILKICQATQTNYIQMLMCDERTIFLEFNVSLKLLAVLFWERGIYPSVSNW